MSLFLSYETRMVTEFRRVAMQNRVFNQVLSSSYEGLGVFQSTTRYKLFALG
jgi:hypothetical protein